MSARPRRPRPRPQIPSEHAAQAQVVAHVRYFHPDVLIAAVPNGARLVGGVRAGAKLKAEGMLPGYPDLLVDEARGGWFGLRVEMKRERGGRVGKAQREVGRRLEAAGYRWVVCAGAREAVRVIEEYLALERTGGGG